MMMWLIGAELLFKSNHTSDNFAKHVHKNFESERYVARDDPQTRRPLNRSPALSLALHFKQVADGQDKSRAARR